MGMIKYSTLSATNPVWHPARQHIWGQHTAFREEVHDSVNLTASINIWELRGASKSQVVDTQFTLAKDVSIQQSSLTTTTNNNKNLIITYFSS